MKKVVLLVTVLFLVFTLSGCKSDLGKHERTLGKYDNYVMTLENTMEVDGILQTTNLYYFFDNTNNKTCITSYNPNNLKEQNESGNTPFNCIGVQLEINGDEYYYDGYKAYLFTDSKKTNIQELFFEYLNLEEYEEVSGNKVFTLEVELKDLGEDMKQIFGVSPISDPTIDSSEIIITAIYSNSDKRFIEFKIDFEDYLKNVYSVLGQSVYVAEAYTKFSYGYFDKKYTIDTAVPLNEIDDYPDSLASAELVGYTIIEDQGSIDGNFIDDQDSDVFQFDASGPNQYTVGVSVENNEIVEFIISNFDGQIVQYGMFDGVQGYSTTVELISAGTYYIIINPIEGSIVPYDYSVFVE